ncbi:MAG: hypothetical protein U0271_02015 [Polyangiaceae bacterium]
MKTHPLLHIITLACATASLSACARYSLSTLTEPPAFEPRGDDGVVCVVRAGGVGSALTLPIRDNGALVGATEGASHFCYYAAPGVHVLSAQVSDAADLEIEVAPAARVFVEHKVAIGRDRLVLVDVAAGQAIARRTDYVVIDESDDVAVEQRVQAKP